MLVVLAALVAAPSMGCSRGSPTASAGTPSPDSSAGPAGTAKLASKLAAGLAMQRFAESGLTAMTSLEARCPDRAPYIALRRSLLASMEAWRRSISYAAELAFGPPIAMDEGAGAIGAIDRAMAAGDCETVHKQGRQIEGALKMANLELGRQGISDKALQQALSDSAYDLGQAILESTPYVPDGDDAALADVTGLLDGITAGAGALGIDVSAELHPFEPIGRAGAMADVHDRAALVRATGALGAKLREPLRGVPAYPRFPTLRPTKEVTAFTLPRPAAPAEPPRAALGERLFSDPKLSRGGVRSCATCHVPARAYQDGLVAPASLEPGVTLRRNTPTLLYAPLAALLTWDGRVRTADRQAMTVIHTRAEMGLDDEALTRAVASDAKDAAAFRDAFGHEVGPADIGLALSAFESRALVPGSAPIDRFDETGEGLSPDARAGLDVFAGKGRCARCHVPPVFGGSRPPDFTVPVFSVLGVPAAPGGHALDPDPGRGGVTHRPQDDHAFKTPTLRNVAATAPYFHNGRWSSLEDVVDFYDRGGGRAVGVDVPNQDPDVRPLHLSAEEKRVVLVFLREGLSDAR